MSAHGSSDCSRAAAASSVRPRVTTSSMRTILRICRPGGSATENDSKCCGTPGRWALGAVADLRTVKARRNPTHTGSADPTSLNAIASCSAAQGASPERTLPGTGTSVTSRANSAPSRGSLRLERYTNPAYRGTQSGSLLFTLAHICRDDSAINPAARGAYT